MFLKVPEGFRLGTAQDALNVVDNLTFLSEELRDVLREQLSKIV